MKKFILLLIILCFSVLSAVAYQFPRWSYFPLKVYIEPHKKAPLVRKAFENWTQSTGGLTRFTYIETMAKHPNIIVKFSEVNNNSSFENAVGVTHSFSPYGFYAKANVVIYLTYPGGKVYMPDDEIYAVALHEIGHAMGIKHSQEPKDIMYPVMHGQRALSQNDIHALLIKYKP